MSNQLLFHEPWWLSATTANQFSEVTIKKGDATVGRLPFVLTINRTFRILRMPMFTHLLGPIVEFGSGKYQTRLMNRLSIVRALIDDLPKFDFFRQAIDPSLDDGLAVADGLAFQERGFGIKPQYTFQIDCRNNPDALWQGMHFKVRQHIRRADERYKLQPLDDPERFIHFYRENLKKRGLKSNVALDRLSAVFTECSARSCGEILAAVLPNGAPAAMTFFVWGNGKMYYLLSTRAPDEADSGAVSLLIWSGMKKAHTLGLSFDLDGISTAGIARFYTGFGGQITTRLIATSGRPMYNALYRARRLFVRPEKDSSDFT